MELFSCIYDTFDNIVLSVGISTGNATVGTQIFMFFFTLLLGQYLRHFHGYRTNFDEDPQADSKKKKEVFDDTKTINIDDNSPLNAILDKLQRSRGTQFKMDKNVDQDTKIQNLEGVIQSLQESKDAQTDALIQLVGVCKELSKGRDDLLHEVSNLKNQVQNMSTELENVKHRHVRMTKSQGKEILNHLSSKLKGNDGLSGDTEYEKLHNVSQQEEVWMTPYSDRGQNKAEDQNTKQINFSGWWSNL